MTVYSSIPRAAAERTRARVFLSHKVTPEMVNKIAVKNSPATWNDIAQGFWSCGTWSVTRSIAQKLIINKPMKTQYMAISFLAVN